MQYRVMLVEDEIIVAMDLQQRLEKLGYQVVGHSVAGDEAVRMANGALPDLILMDIKLRGPLDGIQTAALIRETLDVPVIYLTAFADETTVRRARLTEAFGYLIKPFEDRELHSAIEIALYKHSMESRLRESEERYALATRAANDGIWDWNLKTGTVYYSERWKSMLGCDPAEVRPETGEWFNRVHPDDAERLRLAIDTHLKGLTESLECEYRIQKQDGSYRWMLCRGLALFNKTGQAYRFAGSQSDITDRKNIEDQLVQRALYDEVTGLPNRALFIDRLQGVFERAKREPNRFGAVLFLDIDHFKMVNDSLGHVSGNKLLTQIAQRLGRCVRGQDTVARFGGDEFAILVDGITSEEEAVAIARLAREALTQPIEVDGQEVFATASIGIVFTTNEYASVDDLLRDVDTAMYSAKNRGRDCFEIFDLRMREHTLARVQLENELRKALDHQEFCLYYQPVISVAQGRITGVEALIRWQHPTRGLLAPGQFIPTAEESGLIIPIGEWVLREACAQMQSWHLAGYPGLNVAINLSGTQLREHDLAAKIARMLQETGLDGKSLELEVTESVAMQDMESTKELLNEITRLGVKISIDDFGSGYSSLEHLKHFPAHILKIDRSFINEMEDEDTAIVNAMIQLAHQLNMIVIAEGVEMGHQLNVLTSLACDRVQGYLFEKAMPAEHFLSGLQDGSLERRILAAGRTSSLG